MVGLRGLELRAKHAVLSNRSPSLPQYWRRGLFGRAQRGQSEPVPLPLYGGLSAESFCDQMSLRAANRAERTGVRPPLERYCWSISGAKGAPRSCPAGSIAEVGLRWCGAPPRNRNEGSQCPSLRRRDRGRQRQRPFQPQNHRDTLRAMLRPTKLMRARSNRASWRCCNHPRERQLTR